MKELSGGIGVDGKERGKWRGRGLWRERRNQGGRGRRRNGEEL